MNDAVSSSKIAVIGAGSMGEPMAANLLKNGFPVVVSEHRNHEPIQRLVVLGATVAASPAAATQQADVALLMLPSSKEVEEVLLGEDGIIDTLKPGSIVIDCSTSDPESTRRLAKVLAKRDIGLVDAPVSRGVHGAHNGSLAFFIGGEDKDVERVMPYLQAMGTDHFRFGPAGTGHTAKILNNMISLSTITIVAEATELARQAGLDIQSFYDAVMAGNGKSGTIEAFGQRFISRDYSKVNFRVELATKDLSLSRELAAKSGLPFLVSAAAHHTLQLAQMQGLSKKDISNIAEFWST